MRIQVIKNVRHGIITGIPGQDRFNMVFMTPEQHGPEHDQHGIQKSVAVFFMTKIFDIQIFHHFPDKKIIIRVKDQEISFCFPVENMSKKLCQSTVCRK